MLEVAQCRGPQFHLVQIVAQAIQRVDQIVDDNILGRFRHGTRVQLCLLSDVNNGSTRSVPQKALSDEKAWMAGSTPVMPNLCRAGSGLQPSCLDLDDACVFGE